MKHKFALGLLIGFAAVLFIDVVSGQVITDIKTPPMKDSDTYRIPFAVHPGVGTGKGDPGSGSGGPYLPPYLGAGWAGQRVKVHVQDASELDIVGLAPAPGKKLRVNIPGAGGILTTGPLPAPELRAIFGPISNGVQTQPIFFTVWDSNAQQSGKRLLTSINEPLFDLTVHAKNTSPANNSDVDVTFMFSDIWHLNGGPGTNLIEIRESDWWFVNSQVTDPLEPPGLMHITNDPFFNSAYDFPTAPGPTTDDPNGHWIHMPDLFVHTFGGPGSQFISRMVGGITTLGIEHVPEPTAVALLGAGVVCSVLALRSRSKRRMTD